MQQRNTELFTEQEGTSIHVTPLTEIDTNKSFVGLAACDQLHILTGHEARELAVLLTLTAEGIDQ